MDAKNVFFSIFATIKALRLFFTKGFDQEAA
jgi:hypothetical protein